MSVHVEWVNATTQVNYVPPMHYWDGEEATPDDKAAVAQGFEVADLVQDGAIVIGVDSALVIEGTSEQLINFARSILAAIPGQEA